MISKEDLSAILRGKVVFVGIGNPLRGDDGFGPALIQALDGQINAVCIDAGTAPESYAGKVIKQNPDTVVFVDAADLALAPGACEILGKSDILKTGFTTHDLSPALLIEFLESQITSGIYLLGVQPKVTAFGSEMSPEVSQTLQELARMIKEVLHA